MPANSLIVGVDLSPIKPIPRTITFQSDITTDKCRATIRSHLKTWKADTVLHDGAPNVGTAWVQDAFSQAELVLQAMKLATEFLVEGGTFVTKVFRSKDYNALLWVFNQLFTKVEATKPPSSRNVSAEIFVVCRGFKAPKRIDPRFLDPRSVFAELSDPTPNNEAKVFNPEKKKRKREGYEEGDYIQFKEVPASEFIQTTDPIAMLGSLNRLNFDHKPNGDIALAALDRLPETTTEIRQCCKDLRVLGRKEFRALLRWRLKVRDIFGFSSKKKEGEAVESEEVAEITPMDEELRIQEELEQLNDRNTSRKKREKRRENEKKQREIIRMQMHMTPATEIGLEQAGPSGEDSMFRLATVDRAGAIERIVRGRMVLNPQSSENKEKELSESSDGQTDDEEDQLDRELETLYERYQNRKSESDAKFRAKKARKEHDDGEWGGLSEDEISLSDEVEEEDSEQSSSEEDNVPYAPFGSKAAEDSEERNGGLSKRAAMFFDQEIFQSIGDLEVESDADSGIDMKEDEEETTVMTIPDHSDTRSSRKLTNGTEAQTTSMPDRTLAQREDSQDEYDSDQESQSGFEIVKGDDGDEWDKQGDTRADGRLGKSPIHVKYCGILISNFTLDIDIITAEAMTLAQQVASGQKSSYDLVDDGFNKYAFRDRDGLPEWFLDDEGKHSKPHRPISAAGAAAIKEKLRVLNARPIKKVREAKDRKRFRAAQRLEKLRKKSAVLAEEEGMTEKDKASNIAKLMSKAVKKKPKQQVKVVVARGGNRGISGRPRGVKGKYKIVDARLKKDVRAEKRLSKKRK